MSHAECLRLSRGRGNFQQIYKTQIRSWISRIWNFEILEFKFPRTCRYRSWRAAGDSEMTSEASLSARDAFCSPSAAITFARASRAASASAAIARLSCTGGRTSFLQKTIMGSKIYTMFTFQTLSVFFLKKSLTLP